ncbi:MAG: oligoribonuclease [Gammaproteobacteria bacterium]|nr:oligoribonuclease [Gammaproteobacteria bacterium]
MSRSDNLVWLDMEMTGLDPEVDGVLEIAIIVTDSDLDIVAVGPVITVFQEDSLLDAMDEWNVSHHTKSGLLERVKSEGVSIKEAEEKILKFLRLYVDDRASPLCGNSIGQDRRFIVRYLPHLDNFLHYRSIDVSTIKELAKRWRPEIYAGFEKSDRHQALEDVRESIEELKFYRELFFRMSAS